MSYELHINAGVSGQPSVDSLTSAVDKAAASQQRIAAAIQAHIEGNTKLSETQAKLALQEVTLEQLREKHRMGQDALSAAALRGAAAQNALATGMNRTVGSTMAASSALRVMEGAMPLRAAANFLGTLQGIGPVLQLAFPLFRAGALVEVFGKITTGAQKFIKELEEGPTRIQQRFRELNSTFQLSNDELRLSNDRIADTIAKLEHKPRNLLAEALDEARVNADKLAQSLTKDVEKVKELIEKNSVGSFRRMFTGEAGTGDIEKQFGGYQRVVSDINYAGNVAVHAARTPAEAKRAQGQWDAALAAALAFERRKIGAQITDAGAPHTRQTFDPVTGRMMEAPETPGAQAARLAVLRGVDTNLMEQGDTAALRTRAAALEGELPAARANAEASTKAAAERERMTEREKRTKEEFARAYFGDEQSPERKYNTAISRINTESSDAVRKNPAMAGRINADADVQRMAAFMVKIDEATKLLQKHNDEMDKGIESIDKGLSKAAIPGSDFDLSALTGGFDIAPPSGYVSPAEQMRQARRSGAAGVRGARAAGPAAVEGAQDRATELEYRAQVRINEAKLRGNDLEIANLDALETKKERLFDAQLQREDAIQALVERQKEEMVSMAAGLIMAAQHGGAAGYLKSQLEGIESKVLTNAARMAIDSPAGKAITDKLHAGAGSTLGKLLEGTPFGPDPMKTAGVTLTSAGLKLIAAADRLSALSPSGGGGSVGGGRGIGSIPGLGGSGSPGVGYSETDTPTYGLPTDGSPGDWAGEYGPATSAGRAGGMAKGLGIAGAAAAGAFGIYSGLRSGGARGDMSAAGSALGMVGAILPMLSKSLAVAGPIGMAAGMALGLVTTLMGDPKAQRQTQIARTLQTSQFMGPVAVNASMSSGGGYSDMDRFGNVRDSNFSPFPSVSQGFFDYRNNTTVPGRTNSQFGGQGGTTVVLMPGAVQAIDTKSIIDHHAAFGDAIAKSLQLGSSPALAETLSGRGQ